MKKTSIAIISLVLALSMASACTAKEKETTVDQTATTPYFESKTEIETQQVNEGIVPQIVEKEVNYVRHEKDGEWEIESFTITNWNWREDFYLPDTAWVVESDNALEIFPDFSKEYENEHLVAYMHIANEGFDTSNIQLVPETFSDGSWQVSLNIETRGEILTLYAGEGDFYDNVQILGAVLHSDGSTDMKVKIDGSDTTFFIPSTVVQISSEDFYSQLPNSVRYKTESETYIDTISFSDLPTFESGSADLSDYIWDDDISNTSLGTNRSPELHWDAVDGAASYCVVMIDGGWLHMDVYTDWNALAGGQIERGSTGSQYVGPYPPEGSVHTYSVFIFALKGEPGKVPFYFDNSGNNIDNIFAGLDTDAEGNTGNVIAYSRLDGNFSH